MDDGLVRPACKHACQHHSPPLLPMRRRWAIHRSHSFTNSSSRYVLKVSQICLLFLINPHLCTYRRASEMLYRMSLVEAMSGSIPVQLGHLENIISNHNQCGCVPPGLLARTLKDKGQALATIALTRGNDEDKKVRRSSGLVMLRHWLIICMHVCCLRLMI